jgi:hypothetical protein
VQRRALGLLKIGVAHHTPELPPLPSAGMAMGADVAATHPSVIGALVVGTALLRRVERSPTSSWAREQGGWGRGSLRAGPDSVLTGLTAGLVAESGKGLRPSGGPLDGRGGRGRRMPRGGSTPSPRPTQEQTAPEQAEEHRYVEELVVSPVISHR